MLHLKGKNYNANCSQVFAYIIVKTNIYHRIIEVDHIYSRVMSQIYHNICANSS
jgi:hypothetical protein